MTASDDDNSADPNRQQQQHLDNNGNGNSGTNISAGAGAGASASASAGAQGVGASSSHPNLLALLDAASRVDTLPVPPERGQDEDEAGPPGSSESEEKNSDTATAAPLLLPSSDEDAQNLPKTNALTAEMVWELTNQKAAQLGSKSAASKKSTQAKFRPKRPKLPISTAQPRLAGSAAPTTAVGTGAAADAAGDDAGSDAGTRWTVDKVSGQYQRQQQNQQQVVPPPPTTYHKIKAPKPIKLEPIQKETFPVLLYRVLMADLDEEDASKKEDKGGEGEEEAEPTSSSSSTSTSAPPPGENPSEAASGSTDHYSTNNNKNEKKKKKKGYDDIIRWLPEGTHFVIVDTDRFVTEVMPKEFGVSQKLTSFTRRLSRWGFQQVRVPGYAQHMAFCHPKFRRGDKASVDTIRSVQAQQGARNVAQAKRLNNAAELNAAQSGGVHAHIHAHHVHAGVYNNPGGQPPIIFPAADAPLGELTGALPVTGTNLGVGTAAATAAANPYGHLTAADLHNPIVAARLRAAAALEVEEETLRIQHLERQLQLQLAQAGAAEAQASASAAPQAGANTYDGYIGVGAGAPHTGLQSLAARNAASALTRRYSGTGSTLAAMGHSAAAAVAAPAAGATTSYGQSLADMHYARAAQGRIPIHLAAEAQVPAPVAPSGLDSAGAVDLAHGPPSIFGSGSQVYAESTPLEREIMLQARYKHLLNIQASLQRKALVSQQHHLHLEEQQYLAAHQHSNASLATVATGGGVGGSGQGQLLPQDAVDSATRHVLAGAAAAMQRDSLLTGHPAAGAPAAGYPHF